MKSTKRTQEIDFVKGVMITLMVLFHLTYFTHLYPKTTDWVYSFHMPIFLVFSGFLFNVNKKNRDFLLSLRSIVIPYIVFSIVYLISLNFLGAILKSQGQYTYSGISDLIYRVAFAPAGTYWYLHTISICMLVIYFVHKSLSSTMRPLNIIIVSGLLLYLISSLKCGVSWSNILYFLIGVTVRHCNISLTDRKYISRISIVVIFIITIFNNEFSRGSLAGVGLTLFMLNALIAIYNYAPHFITTTFVFMGKNTLSVLLFSPIFTTLTKFITSYFYFDSTHIMWAMFSTIIVLSFCVLSSIVSDKLKVSRLLVGRNMFYV